MSGLDGGPHIEGGSDNTPDLLVPQESLSEAIDRLVKRGFRHSLCAQHGRLQDLETGKTYEPELLRIEETLRFEGDSDPDEQAVLFALRSPGGDALGTYSVVYGPATPPDDADVVIRLGGKS